MTVRRISDITPSEVALRRAARSALELQADRVAACKTCPKPVWFTAFFDGTGNNFDKDGSGSNDARSVKYSNVAKLAQFAHALQDAIPRRSRGSALPSGKAGSVSTGNWSRSI